MHGGLIDLPPQEEAGTPGLMAGRTRGPEGLRTARDYRAALYVSTPPVWNDFVFVWTEISFFRAHG